MLLAIDVGNTQTVYGAWNGSAWLATWRKATNPAETEDELAAWLKAMFELSDIPFAINGAVCGSVVPGMNSGLAHLTAKWLGTELIFLRDGASVGLSVSYQPATSVGPDRIANAIAILEQVAPPAIVVDFGTATTFDCINKDGTYVGGAILPGILVAAEALVGRTARLPAIELKAPQHAIGTTTVESLQSGLMLGYAGAIDALVEKIQGELGVSAVWVTGGLGPVFMDLCRTLQHYDAHLTLDGLRLAHQRFTQ